MLQAPPFPLRPGEQSHSDTRGVLIRLLRAPDSVSPLPSHFHDFVIFFLLSRASSPSQPLVDSDSVWSSFLCTVYPVTQKMPRSSQATPICCLIVGFMNNQATQRMRDSQWVQCVYNMLQCYMISDSECSAGKEFSRLDRFTPLSRLRTLAGYVSLTNDHHVSFTPSFIHLFIKRRNLIKSNKFHWYLDIWNFYLLLMK